MGRKTRKKIIISIVCLVVCYFSIYFTGILDRLNLRKNNVNIEKCDPIIQNDLEVNFVSNFDTLIIMKNNHIYFSEILVDWYGKDHVIVKRRNKFALITYGEFKRNSWEKVKVNIRIKSDSSNHLIVQSALNTIYRNISRTDTL